MKPLAYSLVVFAAALAVHTCHSASLLINGDAETGTLQGWRPVLSGASTGNTGIIASVTQQTQYGPTVYPYEGSRFFSFVVQMTGVSPDSGEQVYMYQVGTSGLTNVSLRLNGFFQTEGWNGGDEGEARIVILDAASNAIASASSGPLSYPRFPVEQWNVFEVSLGIPSGAASWRVELRGTVRTGVGVNVFWDALEMESIPEHLASPRLSISPLGNQVLLSWPKWATNFTLQCSSDLTATNWATLTNTPIMTGDQLEVPITSGSAQAFYRLVSQ